MQAQNIIEKNLPIHAYAALMLATAILLVMIQSAVAIDSTMGAALCNIAGIVYGNVGRGIATLAVMVVGIGAMMGKTSWGMALMVATGIAVMFNAGNLVSQLGVGDGC